MKHRRKRRTKVNLLIVITMLLLMMIGILAIWGMKQIRKVIRDTPEELIVEYMGHIEKQEYDEMYSMIDTEENFYLNKEEYVERNSKIYEGIEIKNLRLNHIVTEKQEGKRVSVAYETSCDTVAGELTFKNTAIFIDTKDGYKLLWQDHLIFPDLSDTDKVRVSTSQAQRGQILDRNGRVLAGKGTASSVGIVPGKLEDKENSLKNLADLLEVDVETIKNKLEAGWVKEDSFVPIATRPKVQELDLMSLQPKESVLEEHERQKKILEIPGVMMTDIEVRSYGLGEAAAHLVGYVQAVTAEDLENHPGEGYHSNSVIGRTGMEGLFEKELKGKDGCEISIVDKEGSTKTVVASIFKEDGKDIQLTIDYDLQKMLYEQF